MKRITSLGRGGSKNFTRNSRIVTKEHQGHYLNDPMNNIPTDVHYFDTQGIRVIISQRFFFFFFSLSLSLSLFFFYILTIQYRMFQFSRARSVFRRAKLIFTFCNQRSVAFCYARNI